MSEVVVRDPEILSGRPVFRGTRVPIVILFERKARRISPNVAVHEGTCAAGAKRAETDDCNRSCLPCVSRSSLTRTAHASHDRETTCRSTESYEAFTPGNRVPTRPRVPHTSALDATHT